jgi:uncharacterized membrane protein
MSADNDQVAGSWNAEHVPLRGGEAVASQAAIAGHPMHPMLITFPIAFLIFALVADVLYAFTSDAFFARMALWMVATGLATGALAAAVGLIDFVSLSRPREVRAGWVHAIGNGVVLVLAAISLYGRFLGDEDFIVPWGLALSAIIGLLLSVTGWYGGELSYRYLIGVDPRRDDDERPVRSELE